VFTAPARMLAAAVGRAPGPAPYPRPVSDDETWSTAQQVAALALRGRTARTAVPMALIVGTILTAVNLGAIILAGDATTGTWIRLGINYLVPFLVASYGWLSARRKTS